METIYTKYAHIDGLDKKVSRIFFGTANPPMLGGENADALLDAAMSYGLNSFDCARGYGDAEKALGSWIKARQNREQVVVLTKCGDVDENGKVCVNRRVIEEELETSLNALQTDYIDIYLLHRDDPGTPISEYMDTLNEAYRAGKIRIFGASNWTCERIMQANHYAKANGLKGFSISSPNFGLAEQICDPWGGGCVTITGEQNTGEREWYKKTQMPILAYSSLARGLMAGKIKSTQEDLAGELLDPFTVRGYVSHDNFQRLARCEEMALKKGCTIAQLAVAWMFTQGMNLFADMTTTKPERMGENLKALYIPITEREADYLNLKQV